MANTGYKLICTRTQPASLLNNYPSIAAWQNNQLLKLHHARHLAILCMREAVHFFLQQIRKINLVERLTANTVPVALAIRLHNLLFGVALPVERSE